MIIKICSIIAVIHDVHSNHCNDNVIEEMQLDVMFSASISIKEMPVKSTLKSIYYPDEISSTLISIYNPDINLLP